ncbi:MULTISPECIES: thermonuclease family protein [Piscinibacter]|uniref:thermonuclease family protein n=1 Tax=Piscinibacter TaxID=1114981 RepID=UPI000FDF1461|nr:thermonuclease family protein [Piscinibacter defluvii]
MQGLITTLIVALLAMVSAGETSAGEIAAAAQLARAIESAAQPLHAADVVVTGISDGDTAKVELDGRSVRLRLARIDAPEHQQPWGNRSEQSLRELVWKKLVHIEWREVDRHGRPIVSMTIDGRDVSTEQVRRGLAWVYRAYSLDPELIQLEERAREAKIGLWADPKPVPPWEWRKLKRASDTIQ